jgi:hypothetical protein
MTVRIVRRDNGEALEFDASPEQRHSPSAAVSTQPIDDGAAIADHSEKNARKIKVEAITTATPFVSRDESPPDNPIQSALDFLESAAEVPLRLETSLDGTYEPVLLKRWPYTVDVVRDRGFSLEFVQVRIADARTVRIPERKQPTVEPRTDYGQVLADMYPGWNVYAGVADAPEDGADGETERVSVQEKSGEIIDPSTLGAF